MRKVHDWCFWVSHLLVLFLTHHPLLIDAFHTKYDRQLNQRIGSCRHVGLEENVYLNKIALHMARARGKAAKQGLDERWFPQQLLNEEFDNLLTENDARDKLQKKSLTLMAGLIQKRLKAISEGTDKRPEQSRQSTRNSFVMAQGKFLDLANTIDGERILEQMFDDEEASAEDDNVIRGAIIALQSLLILGMQLGLKGSPEQLERYVSHLADVRDKFERDRDLIQWDSSSVRRLKHRGDRSAGVQLLAEMKRKRAPQGAWDLLVEMGVWTKHEDLVLLRSGFSLRFSDEAFAAARVASGLQHDPEILLGLRKDFRYQKVYTVDGAGAMEIDDGLAVETFKGEDGSDRIRYWIHIADADRWAPRNSKVFEVAKTRGVSVYLPQGSVSMFPSSISTEVMSLKANKDCCALSLGVELDDYGSIIDSSIVVTSSLVRVSYRLTYDEVDEMLQEGAAFHEEWQLGALMSAASKRRKFRMRNGSSEAFVPTQIPQYNIVTYTDKSAPDGIGIQLNVQVSHNSGKNESTVEELKSTSSAQLYAEPVSSASTLVTEMMILAGEAIGRWKMGIDAQIEASDGDSSPIPRNRVRLPFRTQPKPDYRSRAREKKIMIDLLAYDVGDGYCHAWYARRFLAPVKVSEDAKPHAGLGLDCYAQWTSPIRRFSDLQVHCVVKRYLRRQRVNELIAKGEELPPGLTATDLGCNVPMKNDLEEFVAENDMFSIDEDINYLDRSQLLGVARNVQRQSQRYWLLEHIRRLREKNPGVTFEVVVLGCVDPQRRQYAIYIYELGFEYRYVTPVGSLKAGTVLRLKVANVFPRSGQLLLTEADI